MFDPAVFAARRDAYMQAIGRDAVAVVRSLPERLRNGDAFHPFRQLSDLVYLTGFVEPDTTLVLRPGADSERVVMSCARATPSSSVGRPPGRPRRRPLALRRRRRLRVDRAAGAGCGS